MFVNGDQVTPETIIEVWKKENWEGVVYNVTQKGLRTILSSPWYLNYISYGSDAMKLYLVAISTTHFYADSSKKLDHFVKWSSYLVK